MQLTLATITQSRRSNSDFGGRQAQLVQLVVDGGFFLDVDVARRDVRFRLVVVVVADEILHRVIREEGFELVVELRGQRLVVRQNQRGPADGLDHLGHGEGLPRARHAQQHLVLLPFAHSPRSTPRSRSPDRREGGSSPPAENPYPQIGISDSPTQSPAILPVFLRVLPPRPSCLRGELGFCAPRHRTRISAGRPPK